MNEDGEPIMDGAAWRFECALDDQAADEARMDYDDAFYANYPDECPDCGDDECEGDCQDEDDDEPFVMEDQWLDSYMEDRMTTMFE
jgi:hypothetical protein